MADTKFDVPIWHKTNTIKSLPDSTTLLHSIPILLLNGLTEIFRFCLQW